MSQGVQTGHGGVFGPPPCPLTGCRTGNLEIEGADRWSHTSPRASIVCSHTTVYSKLQKAIGRQAICRNFRDPPPPPPPGKQKKAEGHCKISYVVALRVSPATSLPRKNPEHAKVILKSLLGPVLQQKVPWTFSGSSGQALRNGAETCKASCVAMKPTT